MKPKVAIGMFTHNEEKHLKEALDSLLSQTYRDFKLIILDDNSSDNTRNIIKDYSKKDNRISFHENTKRMGYIANYIKTFELAGNNNDYFGWAAGHDIHEPTWLENMVTELNNNPDVIMSYPLIERIDDNGKSLNIPSTRFETKYLNKFQRINRLFKNGVGYGNMIYGLFRADVLPKVGIFKKYLIPDGLLLWEVSLYGSISQIQKVLWIRRYPPSIMSMKRQRRNAFSKAPFYSFLFYPFANSFAILFDTILFPPKGHRNLLSRLNGLYMMLLFIAHFTKLELKKLLMSIGFVRDFVLSRKQANNSSI